MIIESAFEIYEKEVIPKDAGPVQRSETKQAFFGGAAITITALLKAMDLDGESQTEDESVERLALTIEALRDESVAFKNQLLNRN